MRGAFKESRGLLKPDRQGESEWAFEGELNFAVGEPERYSVKKTGIL